MKGINTKNSCKRDKNHNTKHTTDNRQQKAESKIDTQKIIKGLKKIWNKQEAQCNKQILPYLTLHLEAIKNMDLKSKTELFTIPKKVIPRTSSYDLNLLQYTVLYNLEDAVTFILENELLDVDAKMDNGATALHLAVQNGHIKLAKLLLERGANVNHQTSTCFTPLQLAIKNGRIELVELLITHKVDVNAKMDNGATVLYLVVQNGNIKLAELLCEHGANVNNQTSTGLTPLHYVLENDLIEHDRIELVKLLIKHGTNVNVKGVNDITPLHMAVQNGHIKLAKLLLDSVNVNDKNATVNAKMANNITPLHFAAQDGNIKLAELLLERGANVNDETADGITPLHFAARERHIELAELLREHGATVNAKIVNDIKVLYWVVDNNHIKLAKLLFEGGANVNNKTSDGFTPLHYAEKNGYIELAELLREHGATEDENQIKDSNGKSLIDSEEIKSPLKEAENSIDEQEADPEQKKKIIELPTVDKTNTSETDSNPVSTSDDFSKNKLSSGDVSTLISTSSDIGSNAQDILTDAIPKKHTLTTSGEVLPSQEEINIKPTTDNRQKKSESKIDNGKKTKKIIKGFKELWEIEDKELRHTKMSQYLASHLEPIKEMGTELFTIPEEVVSRMPDYSLGNHFNLLHYAVLYNRKDIVSIIVENKLLQVNDKTSVGITALHLAVANIDIELVTLLIKHKANVNAETVHGIRPLYLAVKNDHIDKYGHAKLAELLIAHGAKVNITSSSAQNRESKQITTEGKNQKIDKSEEDQNKKLCTTVMRFLKDGIGTLSVIEELLKNNKHGLQLDFYYVVDGQTIIDIITKIPYPKLLNLLLPYVVKTSQIKAIGDLPLVEDSNGKLLVDSEKIKSILKKVKNSTDEQEADPEQKKKIIELPTADKINASETDSNPVSTSDDFSKNKLSSGDVSTYTSNEISDNNYLETTQLLVTHDQKWYDEYNM